MSVEKEVHAYAAYITDQVEGGTSSGILEMVDIAIDSGAFDAEFFYGAEMAILSIVDQEIFQCDQCSWTLPISEMSDETENYICNNCYNGD